MDAIIKEHGMSEEQVEKARKESKEGAWNVLERAGGERMYMWEEDKEEETCPGE